MVQCKSAEARRLAGAHVRGRALLEADAVHITPFVATLGNAGVEVDLPPAAEEAAGSRRQEPDYRGA
jgi:hypothetical protein